jgi:hypothetical protein
MKELCIVPCGSRKIWDKYPEAGPQKARDVYIGPYANKCIEYAERFYPDSWVILSAKYGFLFPWDIVQGPYNITFNNKKTNPIDIDKLAIQIKAKKLVDYQRLIILGGEEYIKMAELAFPGCEISIPLKGLRIGEKLAKMKLRVDKDKSSPGQN